MTKANETKAAKLAAKAAEFSKVYVTAFASGGAMIGAIYKGGKHTTVGQFKSADDAKAVVVAALAQMTPGTQPAFAG